MNNNKIFLLTLMVTFITIMVMLTVFWQIGYPLMFGGVNMNLLIVPVLIGVFILPLKYGLVLGLLMGLSSFILSFALSIPIFQNPLISVLPRVLFIIPTFFIYRFIRSIIGRFPKYGKQISFIVISLVTAFSFYYGLQQIFKLMDWNFSAFVPVILILIVIVLNFYYNYLDRIDQKFIYVPTSLILGTLSHSILTIFMMILFGATNFSGLIALLTTNVLAEAIIVVIIATPIVIVLKTIYPNIEKGLMV